KAGQRIVSAGCSAAVTRMAPAGFSRSSLSAKSSASISSSREPTAPSRRSPAAVGATLRVVRAKSRSPRRASSPLIVWLSADCDTPSFPAALVKLRSLATARNAITSFRFPEAFMSAPHRPMRVLPPNRAPSRALNSFLSAAGCWRRRDCRLAEQTEGRMEIKRSGSQPSGKGPADWFTGTVRIDPLFAASPPARGAGNAVTFEPGARTAWHTHPLGQILIVTFGLGWTQRWGGPVEEIRSGDVVWIPPGEKHWHGASPTTAMTHIAIQEALDGKAVDWMEKVSDEQYAAGSSAAKSGG